MRGASFSQTVFANLRRTRDLLRLLSGQLSFKA